MAKKTTRKRGLQKPTRPDKMPSELGQLLRADRIARKMTWEAYAVFLGYNLSTVYKIADGRTRRPNELTEAAMREKMNLPVRPADNTAEGAADAVVSSGQRHPERSEDPTADR